jgi:tryptophanyl-tRNA synthetase
MFAERVLSGMRPTGNLHLGHYHGVLKNWVRLQSEYPCFFFVADWHALTTHYETPDVIEQSVWDMVIDWLAAGVDPNQATLFIQSKVPEHAELFLLLSMGTPLGWLERVPTYKDQIEKLKEKDLQTYGFLGYPLLQAADILIYRAQHVPVGEDQVPHVEMTREVARRFNYLYGREPGFEEKALEAAKKLGSKRAKMYLELRIGFQERGDDEALEQAKALLHEAQSLSMADRERLFGFLEGSRKIILPEPQACQALMAKRCPSLMATRLVFAKSLKSLLKKSAPCQRTRHVFVEQMPVTPHVAQYGNCIPSTPMKKLSSGLKRAVNQQALVVLSVSSQ